MLLSRDGSSQLTPRSHTTLFGERDHDPADDGEAGKRLGSAFQLHERHVDLRELDMVNAALYLRLPLLVTGRPDTGKSSLAYQIARELGLGPACCAGRSPATSR